MSSILEALKKAEQQSAADQGTVAPWPASPMTRKDTGRRRLWIPIGLIAGGCLLGLVFWLTRALDSDDPSAVVKGPAEPVAARKSMPAAAPLDAQPSAKTPPALAAVPDPMSSVSPPQKKPLPVITPETPNKLPRPQPVPKQQKTNKTKNQPETPPVATPTPVRQPLKTTQAPPPPKTVPKEEQKVFRSDSRLDLQALVWSPKSADRFVVINNRLIKEGGTIDQITVVRINQDDVLLSEGTDRWYQEFKIH